MCVKCYRFRDVRSHGLLVVVTLCCCLSGCELQPVVVTTIAEEVSPPLEFLLLFYFCQN